MTTTSQADYDSPWKEAIERYFPEFMAFFFPQAYADIDWARGYTFLDKELQQVVREAEVGGRRVDKLVKVWRQGGEEAWVLIHVEVQAQKEENFAERMYIYNYRLFDRYKRRVVSLAVLSDEQRGWRPHHYGYELWGCRVSLDFPMVKLLDYEDQWDALVDNDNLFAVVVMAHLKTQATRRDPEGRYEWKISLGKMLYQRGYTRQDILELLRFIDWLMVLPPELEQQFQTDLTQFEKEIHMTYVSTWERMATERGMQQGMQQGSLEKAREFVVEAVEARFGNIPGRIVAVIEQIEDTAVLKTLHKQAITAESLTVFEQTLAEYA